MNIPKPKFPKLLFWASAIMIISLSSCRSQEKTLSVSSLQSASLISHGKSVITFDLHQIPLPLTSDTTSSGQDFSSHGRPWATSQRHSALVGTITIDTEDTTSQSTMYNSNKSEAKRSIPNNTLSHTFRPFLVAFAILVIVTMCVKVVLKKEF